MAFGITKAELNAWKQRVARGEIAFLTHFWLDERFPGITSVTKVGCSDVERLAGWCRRNGLNPQYIHARDEFPHFDLIGKKQKQILLQEQLWAHIERFRL